jgi:hypothetical protein
MISKNIGWQITLGTIIEGENVLEIPQSLRDFFLKTINNDPEDDRLFPILREDWTGLDRKDEAYARISKIEGTPHDFFFIPISISDEINYEVGQLKIELQNFDHAGEHNTKAKTQNFLSISFPMEHRLYYLDFVITCCQYIDLSVSGKKLRGMIERWIDAWKKSRAISMEKRIGLFGELNILRSIMSLGISTQWDCWQERISHSGLHDFELDHAILEVKTSVNVSEETMIHVFDSNQFQHNEKLYLLFLNLSISDEGETLSKVCDDIADAVEKGACGDEEAEKIMNVFLKLGYPFDLDENPKFSVIGLDVYHSGVDSPFIQEDDFRKRGTITNIEYSISHKSIPFFISESSLDEGLQSLFAIIIKAQSKAKYR